MESTVHNNSPSKRGNDSPSPTKSPSQPLLSRSSSSDSRARAIAQGKWELMEMVKNMPEYSYELSMKDIVETQEARDNLGSPQEIDQDLDQRAVVKSKRSKEGGKKVVRSSGFENRGLFLKMVFPVSLLRSREKNKSVVVVSYSKNKVLPKVDGTGERELWKKRFSGSGDGNRSVISNSRGGEGSGGGSSSDRGRKINGLMMTGCWPIFCSRGRKSVE